MTLWDSRRLLTPPHSRGGRSPNPGPSVEARPLGRIASRPGMWMRVRAVQLAPHQSGAHLPVIPAKAGISDRPQGRSVCLSWIPRVHGTSATPARVLLRWDDIMTSSRCASASRLIFFGARARQCDPSRCGSGARPPQSVGSCDATPAPPNNGRAPTTGNGLTIWRPDAAAGTPGTSWRVNRNLLKMYGNALRWDIRPNRSPAG